MIESTLLQWLLTILFSATGCWSVAELVTRQARGREQIDALCHLFMSAFMVAMLWPWGMGIPAAPQILLFTVAALWFLATMVLGIRETGGRARSVPRLSRLHHVLMMGAMAWMVAVMPALMHARPADDGGGHHHALASATAVSLAEPSAQVSVATVAVTTVLGALLILASLPWLSSALDHGRAATLTAAQRRTALTHAGHAAMSLGMGVASIAML
ncbi:DUF5134 domain-containing protein [Amycolatopsis antarctica]|uniref:DUF5134 domain-containing protein n=1 Tax=Amycolatopsis antarctica TaxID=1854586 RepID=A0A263CYI5_9PSEU|nr:DUF5134 domain-containing protein [Amycolatopsis antarctica]OZM70165.1 DUF5134 domain-containing protein [Amycolatopsis antarctica]